MAVSVHSLYVCRLHTRKVTSPSYLSSTQLETGPRGGSSSVGIFLPSKQKEGEPYVSGPMGCLCRTRDPAHMAKTSSLGAWGMGGEVLTQPLQPPVLGNVSSEF